MTRTRTTIQMNWLQKISGMIESPELDAITAKWEATIPGMTMFVYEQENRVVLSSLIIPRKSRNQGLGSQIMQELTAYADSVGKRMELSPGTRDQYNGTTSRGRLVRFYKNFGFRENKGRRKDYRTSETMLREPIRTTSASVVRIQPHPIRFSPEYDRQNPEKPISFFEYDGNNLYVAEGKASDSHVNLFPLAFDMWASGRVDREANKGSFNLDPDLLTADKFEQIMLALNEEYPGCQWRAEYYGQWYNSMSDLRDELGTI